MNIAIGQIVTFAGGKYPVKEILTEPNSAGELTRLVRIASWTVPVHCLKEFSGAPSPTALDRAAAALERAAAALARGREQAREKAAKAAAKPVRLNLKARW